MNRDVLWLTARQLLGKRRTLLMGLFALLPVGLAVAFRVYGDGDPARWTATTLLGGVVVGTLLPLASLVFGTAALGLEIEDGTAVYILAKPLPRRDILLSKLAVAWAVTSAFVLVSAVASAAISIQSGADGPRLIAGFLVATLLGSLGYCAVFLPLSLWTSRALVAGLIYVLVWEGIVTRLFTGIRVFSVRQYTLGIAGRVADASPRTFEADMAGQTAAILLVLVVIAATLLAIRRLQRFEAGEAG